MIPYHSFHTGYKQMNIRPEELLRGVRLPRTSAGLTHYYRKVGTRKAQAISKVCFAGVARMNGDQIVDVRVALGSVAPVPIRCLKTEAALLGQIISVATATAGKSVLTAEIAPIDDLRSTSDYRLRVSINLLGDFIHGLSSS